MNPQDPYHQPPQQPQAPPAGAPMGQQPYYPQQPSPAYQTPPPYPPATAQQPPQLQPLSTPTDSNQYPVDYLNQIAAPAPQKTANKFAVFGLIFGFLAIIVTAVAVISGAGTPSITAQATLMRDRVRALKIVTVEQQKRLAQSDLSGLNATLTASLTTTATDLTELLGEKVGSGNGDKPKDETMKAFQASLSQKLNDAYLAGTLDRTYASEMAYQLKLLRTQMKKLAATGKTKAAKNFYNKNAPTIDTIAQKLADVTTSQ